jgi:hypothetical protein
MESMPYRENVAMTIQIHRIIPLDEPSILIRKLKAGKNQRGFIPSLEVNRASAT